MMTDETSKLLDRVKKLEQDNVQLIDYVKEKDAKIYELNNQVG